MPGLSSTIATAGRQSVQITATFSPRFLALVSEHLYPSANKAFEELITNCWDADAGNVYVNVPRRLDSSNAAIYILDDGASMDVDGLQQLWTIAESKKRDSSVGQRKSIGKFGIGKLATYLLCNELTYVCKYSDGIIRLVTMDYRNIEEIRDKNQDKMVLPVREIDEKGLESVLKSYEKGDEVYNIIKNSIPSILWPRPYYDEYGGLETAAPSKKDTWTLAIMTSLKPAGQEIEVGRTKYMLRTALPLGTSMKIKFNETVIEPSKLNTPVNKRWTIGPELPFDEIDLYGEKIKIEKKTVPTAHIVIPGLGEVSGSAVLFRDSVAGGKSGVLEASNGCFVNVLGRVVNLNGSGQFSVGESARGTFAKFRATVRMDGLDKLMTIQRDALVEKRELVLANAFLLRLFNLARALEEKMLLEEIAAAGRVRQGQLGALPFNRVAAVLQSTMEEGAQLPSFFDHIPESGPLDIESWITSTENGRANSLEGYSLVDEDPKKYLARYGIGTRTILINKNHPFYLEHSSSQEQRACLEDMVAVHLLSDAYLIDSGVSTSIVDNMIAYRDACERTVAQIRRTSPTQIIQLLKEWGDDPKPLEEIVGDALLFLGYSVERLAKPGEPEGVATAFITPKEPGLQQKYSFNYDTKSTTNDAVQTGNVHMAGLKRHRNKYNCNYTLLVGPKFQKGALEIEASDNKVTPMTTESLCDLLSLCIGYGPLGLQLLEEMFQYHSPDDVKIWISKLKTDLSKEQHIDAGLLMRSISSLEPHEHLDVLTCSVIARKYRDISNNKGWPQGRSVNLTLQVFSAMAPRLLSVDSVSEKVFLSTSPEEILKELKRQAQSLPAEVKIGAMATL